MLQDQPLASIIIVSHNDETNIETAIHSACNQTIKNIEIICVDDGSTDTTYECMLRCSVCDERIRIIHQENSGILAARYTGLKHVSSAYTFFLDSDDTILPEAVETVCNAANAANADVVEFGVILVMNEQAPVSEETWTALEHYYSHEKPLPELHKGPDLINACFEEHAITWNVHHMLYRTDLLRKAFQFYQGEWVCMGEDTLITLMVLCFAEHYLRIDEKLYMYKVGGGISTTTESLTTSASVKNAAMILLSLTLARKWLEKICYPLDKISPGIAGLTRTIQGITIGNLIERCPPCNRTEFLKWLSKCCSQDELFDLLSTGLNHQHYKIQQQQEHIQRQQEHIQQLYQANQQLQMNYNAISNAFFWKISKPFRVLLDTLKRLFQSHNE